MYFGISNFIKLTIQYFNPADKLPTSMSVKEEWKEHREEGLRSRFLISNLGRVQSITSTDPENPILLSGYKNAGYHAIPTRKVDGKNTLRYVHKLVAELFVPNPDGFDKIIFIDRDRSNCKARNLKWVSDEDYKAYRKEFAKSAYDYKPDFKPNTKLTPAKVKMLKKMINDPNRKTRYKIIAKRFGITVGTLFSIKRGESWKEVT